MVFIYFLMVHPTNLKQASGEVQANPVLVLEAPHQDILVADHAGHTQQELSGRVLLPFLVLDARVDLVKHRFELLRTRFTRMSPALRYLQRVVLLDILGAERFDLHARSHW